MYRKYRKWQKFSFKPHCQSRESQRTCLGFSSHPYRWEMSKTSRHWPFLYSSRLQPTAKYKICSIYGSCSFFWLIRLIWFWARRDQIIDAPFWLWHPKVFVIWICVSIHQEKIEGNGTRFHIKKKKKTVRNYSNIVIPSSLQKAKLG